MWKIVGAGAGLLAGMATRRLLVAAWQRSRGRPPPSNPASASTTWTEAVIYAVASGVAISVARLFAERGAAAAWKKFTGGYPPGLEEVTP
jgi:hypothetical protein